MTFKLALRNITSKPGRALATALAIAIAVAMIFAMLSFKAAVYDFILASETSASGAADIRIATTSSSSRIVDIGGPLDEVEGVGRVTPSLSLYATLGGEYVQVRGFRQGDMENLQDIELVAGSVDNIGIDQVVISKAAADKFDAGVGDRIELSLGSIKINFYVAGISQASGYFLSDSPYKVYGRIAGVGRLLGMPEQDSFCNEIYVETADGYDVNDVMARVCALPAYKDLLVQATGDNGYIEEQTSSLTAPVVLAGAAVFALGIAIIVLLFMMSEQEKVNLISRLSVVGATRGLLMGIFLAESGMLALAGVVLGAGLAVGIFTAICKFTLSMSVSYAISAGKLLGAIAIGFVAAIVSSLYPIFKSMRGSIRQNQLSLSAGGKLRFIIPIVVAAALAVLVGVEFGGVAGTAGTAVLGIVGIVLLFVLAATAAGPLLHAAASGIGKISDPTLKVASYDLRRNRRHARSVSLLTVGMTVSMLLFMAWSVTTDVFTGYVQDFSGMVFVSNVRANADVNEFTEVEGVSFATHIVWKQGSLKAEGVDKTVNVLGSAGALQLADFEYMTPKDEVQSLINSGKPYVFIDYAVQQLYGIGKGDKISLVIDDVPRELEVGGILRHRLFNGLYAVVSADVIEAQYGISPDTVLACVDGDMTKTVGALSEKFASRNYYVVEALEAYRWEMQSTQAVFDLVGTLAAVVTAFILAVGIAATLVGRSTEERSRVAYLNAGMSEGMLLGAEIGEHALVALTAFALSFVLSVPLTACLIHALRLFGLYFEFMYSEWVVAVVGIAMALGYTAVPLVFNFKKKYSVKRV